MEYQAGNDASKVEKYASVSQKGAPMGMGELLDISLKSDRGARMQAISPRQLHDRQQQGQSAAILDVRTPAEHAQIHVAGAHLEPLDRLDGSRLAGVNGFAKDQPIYLLCAAGTRAKKAAEQLEKAGFEQCIVVEGGITAWDHAGLPVVRGTSKVISLERQVRIAAGSIVLTGVILGTWVNPACYGLSAFVGCGLIFAGVTDWCGMAMLLAKMPWNQAGSKACCGGH
jgi:rhodanese-related sulfurtransferase